MRQRSTGKHNGIVEAGALETDWRRPRLLPRWFAFLVVLLVGTWVAPYSLGIFICAGVALYALKGPKECVQALTVLALLILTQQTNIGLGRWLILFAVLGRTVWDVVLSRASLPRVLGVLLIFSLSMLVFSVLASTFPLVSVLKVVTFTVGVSVALASFYQTLHLRGYWMSWFYTLAFFILVASIPLYFSSAGYTRNGAGFQGILSHPQTFGPVLAPITALFTGLYLFHGDRSWHVQLGAVLGWVGMYFSLARTSLLATVLGLGLIVAIGYVFKQGTWGRAVGRALGQPAVMIGIVLVLGFAVLQWTSFQEAFTEFLFKDDAAGSVSQVLEASRGYRINSSMDNFRESPLTGIGFGVPSNPESFARLEAGPLGLPIGASVEKGFMPSAVLEETGVVGALLVIMLLVTLFAPVVRQPDPTLFWMMAAALLINFGEMVFFSVGGMGFYFWLIMAFCHVAALEPTRRRVIRHAPSKAAAAS